MKLTTLSLAFGAILCAQVCAAQESGFAGHLLYQDVARMSSFEVTNGSALVQSMASRRTLDERESADTEAGAYTLKNCSTPQYRCVDGGAFVLAIPARDLRPMETYETLGVKFAVRKCFRGSGTVCQIALIESDCQNRPTLSTCAVYKEGREKAPAVGEHIFFFYNEDFGVTALGFSPSRLGPSDDKIEEIATQFILSGNKGFLAPQ